MQHESCQVAIKRLQNIGTTDSNVHNDEKSCDCKHTPTECLWIGNETQYACLLTEQKAPQRVYTTMNSTKASRIM
mgnify:CR=1 FL=1